jgi:transcriptional regulator with XRE-family HTH domain
MSSAFYKSIRTSYVLSAKHIVMPSKQVKLSDYVRDVMKEKRLSYRDVAQKSGGLISHTTVNDVVNNNRTVLMNDTLTALAKGLDVPEDEVFRVARGLSARPSRFDIYAETFNADGLTDDEWQMLEGYFRNQVDQYKALRSVAQGAPKK